MISTAWSEEVAHSIIDVSVKLKGFWNNFLPGINRNLARFHWPFYKIRKSSGNFFNLSLLMTLVKISQLPKILLLS